VIIYIMNFKIAKHISFPQLKLCTYIIESYNLMHSSFVIVCLLYIGGTCDDSGRDLLTDGTG
jgi:hypothetical protein